MTDITSAIVRADGRAVDQLRPITIERGLEQPGRGFGAHLVRRHEGALHRVVHERRAALAGRQGQGLGHGGVRDAAPRHQQPQRPRERQGQDRRAHARDLAPHRPGAARRRRHQGARREHDRDRLRRAAGRRRHPHRGDHRRVRRARRRDRVGPGEEVHRRRRSTPLIDSVAAVSVGIIDGEPMLDLAYVEDVRAETDMNIVVTGRGLFVEVQGTAEGAPFDKRELDALLELGVGGLRRPARSAGRRPRTPRGVIGVQNSSDSGADRRRIVLATHNRAQSRGVPRDRRRDPPRPRGDRLRRTRARRRRRDLRRERPDQGARRRRAHRSAGARRRLRHLRRRAGRCARRLLGVLGRTREGCRGQPEPAARPARRRRAIRTARHPSSRRSRWSCPTSGVRARRRGPLAGTPGRRRIRRRAASDTTRSSFPTVSPQAPSARSGSGRPRRRTRLSHRARAFTAASARCSQRCEQQVRTALIPD